jgi:DNA replication ATP-dependent helicase Dna2
MLDVNYRSNAEIVGFFREAGYGRDLRSHDTGLRVRLAPRAGTPPDVDAILDPEKPLVALVHDDGFSSQRNEAEAGFVAGLVGELYGRLYSLEHPGILLDGEGFFREGVGIVTPHRAQQAAILERLDAIMPPEVDRLAMAKAVDTVERFQGQQKAVMIASFGIGDPDQIAAEEEFLFGLNRFNVIVSRARAKMIVVMSRGMADHLPRELAVLRGSKLLKNFVGRHLPVSRPIAAAGLERCEIRTARPVLEAPGVPLERLVAAE